MSQRRRGLHTHRFGDSVDGLVGRLQLTLSRKETLMREPIVRGGADLRSKMPCKAPHRHPRFRRQRLDGQFTLEIRDRPLE